MKIERRFGVGNGRLARADGERFWWPVLFGLLVSSQALAQCVGDCDVDGQVAINELIPDQSKLRLHGGVRHLDEYERVSASDIGVDNLLLFRDLRPRFEIQLRRLPGGAW